MHRERAQLYASISSYIIRIIVGMGVACMNAIRIKERMREKGQYRT